MKTCGECCHCIYLGEGDFACDARDYEIVIADWGALRLACPEWSE